MGVYFSAFLIRSRVRSSLDTAMIGSGFAGSIVAMIECQLRRSVLLPMGDFYICDASVKLFLLNFKMNCSVIVNITLLIEGVFHKLVFVRRRKNYPMQAYKIIQGLWGMDERRPSCQLSANHTSKLYHIHKMRGQSG